MSDPGAKEHEGGHAGRDGASFLVLPSGSVNLIEDEVVASCCILAQVLVARGDHHTSSGEQEEEPVVVKAPLRHFGEAVQKNTAKCSDKSGDGNYNRSGRRRKRE